MRVRLYWSLARVAHAENKPTLALGNARKAIALLEATEDTLNLARAHLLAASITDHPRGPGRRGRAPRPGRAAARVGAVVPGRRDAPGQARAGRGARRRRRGGGRARARRARGDRRRAAAGARHGVLGARRGARAPGRARVGRRRLPAGGRPARGEPPLARGDARLPLLGADAAGRSAARSRRSTCSTGPPSSGYAPRPPRRGRNAVAVEIEVAPRGPYSLALSARARRRRDAALPRRDGHRGASRWTAARETRARLAVAGRRRSRSAPPRGGGRAAALDARARRRPLRVPAPRRLDDRCSPATASELRGLRQVRTATVAQSLLRAVCGQLVDWQEARRARAAS